MTESHQHSQIPIASPINILNHNPAPPTVIYLKQKEKQRKQLFI